MYSRVLSIRQGTRGVLEDGGFEEERSRKVPKKPRIKKNLKENTEIGEERQKVGKNKNERLDFRP